MCGSKGQKPFENADHNGPIVVEIQGRRSSSDYFWHK